MNGDGQNIRRHIKHSTLTVLGKNSKNINAFLKRCLSLLCIQNTNIYPIVFISL